MFEKRLAAVPAQLFIANGNTGGMGAIMIASDPIDLFKVKQKVFVSASGLNILSLEIKQISNGIIFVGPLPSPGVAGGISARADLSAYTVAAGANIYADEQKRPSIDNAEINRAVYEEEPAVALRTILVSSSGQVVNTNNPLPIAIESTIPEQWDDIELVYDSNDNLTQASWYLNSTLIRQLALSYDSNDNTTKVVVVI
jgi:hypothetical protein